MTQDLALQQRNALVELHLPLVNSIANCAKARRKIAGMDFDDLLQEGRIGLIKAVDTFDPTRGIEFTKYATHSIIFALSHALRDRCRLVRVPASKLNDEPEKLYSLDDLLEDLDEGKATEIDGAFSCDDEHERSDARLTLATALPQLSDDRRRAVELHFLHDRTKADVARMMNISAMHAGRLINSGLSDLRRILGDTFSL